MISININRVRVMNENADCSFRPIRAGEEELAYELILRVFHKDVAASYSGEGVETFLGMLSPSFLAKDSLDRSTIIAEHNGRIIGVLTITALSHISLLFVDPDFQGYGIGSSLVQVGIDACMKKNPDRTVFTASSSPNSLSFYKTIGFETIGEEVNENGMLFTPMQKTLAQKMTDNSRKKA
ncbi:GNAT family N-acetyltransferase [Methanolobus sp. ZRKC2]|uniref:GNAT family N-acetyltransferase n=1 Tax=Methanolobus sp. ZRKC2 TaxID=3125783 RepID=UPI00324D151C